MTAIIQRLGTGADNAVSIGTRITHSCGIIITSCDASETTAGIIISTVITIAAVHMMSFMLAFVL